MAKEILVNYSLVEKQVAEENTLSNALLSKLITEGIADSKINIEISPNLKIFYELVRYNKWDPISAREGHQINRRDKHISQRYSVRCCDIVFKRFLYVSRIRSCSKSSFHSLPFIMRSFAWILTLLPRTVVSYRFYYSRSGNVACQWWSFTHYRVHDFPH